jgi:hypothetical protein
MKTDDIIKAAKERLAEIEAEAVKLRSMIAAAEGKPTVLPVPNPLPFIPVNPHPFPYQPHTPNIPWPLDRVTCGVLTIETDPNVTCTNGVRVDRTNLIVGGPQRMDPNVRFAS